VFILVFITGMNVCVCRARVRARVPITSRMSMTIMMMCADPTMRRHDDEYEYVPGALWLIVLMALAGYFIDVLLLI